MYCIIYISNKDCVQKVLCDAQISDYLVSFSYDHRRGEETTLASIWMWITTRYVHFVLFHECFTLALHTFLSLHNIDLWFMLNPNTSSFPLVLTMFLIDSSLFTMLSISISLSDTLQHALCTLHNCLRVQSLFLFRQNSPSPFDSLFIWIILLFPILSTASKWYRWWKVEKRAYSRYYQENISHTKRSVMIWNLIDKRLLLFFYLAPLFCYWRCVIIVHHLCHINISYIFIVT